MMRRSDLVIYVQVRCILTAPDFLSLLVKFVTGKAYAYELETFMGSVQEAEMILTLREGLTACIKCRAWMHSSISLCPARVSNPVTSTLASSDDVYRTWPFAASFKPPMEAAKRPSADAQRLWEPPVDASALTARLRSLPFKEIGKWRWSYNQRDGTVVERVEPCEEVSFKWSIKPPATSNADGGLRGGGFEANALTFRSAEVKATRSMPGDAPLIHHPQPRTSYPQVLARIESQMQAQGIRPSVFPQHLLTQLAIAEGTISTSPTIWLKSRRHSVSCERGPRQILTAGPPIGPALLSCDVEWHMEGCMAQNIGNGKSAPTLPPAGGSSILTTLPVMIQNAPSSSSSHTTPHDAFLPHSTSLYPTNNGRTIPADLQTTHSWDSFMADELMNFEREARESPPVTPGTMPLCASFPGSSVPKILGHGGKGRFDKPDEEHSTPCSSSDHCLGSEAGRSTRATSFIDDAEDAVWEAPTRLMGSRKTRRRAESDGDWTPMRGGALNADGHGHPDIEMPDADDTDDDEPLVDAEAEAAATILGQIAGHHFVRRRRNAVSRASGNRAFSSTPSAARAGEEPAPSAMRSTAHRLSSTQMSFGQHTASVPAPAPPSAQVSQSGRRGAIVASLLPSMPSTPRLRPTGQLQISENTRTQHSERAQDTSYLREMRRRLQARYSSARDPPYRGPHIANFQHVNSRVIPSHSNFDDSGHRLAGNDVDIEEGEIVELAPINFNMNFQVPLRDPRQNPRIPPGATTSEIDETFSEEDERIYQAAARAARMARMARMMDFARWCNLEGRRPTLAETSQALGMTEGEIMALLAEAVPVTQSLRQQDQQREVDSSRVIVDEGRVIAARAARLAAIRRAERAGQAPTMSQMREASTLPLTATDAEVVEELNSRSRHVQEERHRVQAEREEREREAEIVRSNAQEERRRVQAEREERERLAEIVWSNRGALITYRVYTLLDRRRRGGHEPTFGEMREALDLPHGSNSEVVEGMQIELDRIGRQEAESAAQQAEIDRRIAEGESRREERRERHAALRAVASRWDLPEYAQLSDTDSRASSTIALERVLAEEVAEEDAAAADAARQDGEEPVELLDYVRFGDNGDVVTTRARTGGGVRRRASSIVRVAELMSDSDGENVNPLNHRHPIIQGANGGLIANPLRPAATREGNARAVYEVLRQRNPEMFQEYERQQALRHPATRISAADMVRDVLEHPSTPPAARDRLGRPRGSEAQTHDDAGPEAWRRDADQRPRWMQSFEDAFPTARIGGIAYDRQTYIESLIRSTAASGHGSGERGGVPEGVWYTCTFRRRIDPKPKLKSDITMVSRSGHVSNPATFYLDYVSEPESDEDEELPFYEWEAMFPAAAIKDMLRSTDVSWGWKAVRARDWALEEMAEDPKSEGTCWAVGEWWERVRGVNGAAGDKRVRRVDVRVVEP